jgi:DNA-binding transcriptional MerR regulator
METMYRIAEVARRSGFATSTLRYYEELGLLQPAARTGAGYRVYGHDVLAASHSSRARNNSAAHWTKSSS